MEIPKENDLQEREQISQQSDGYTFERQGQSSLEEIATRGEATKERAWSIRFLLYFPKENDLQESSRNAIELQIGRQLKSNP